MDDAFVDLLNAVCQPLEDQRIQYAITGSIVSSVYGEPLTSLDVDICLRMSPVEARQLARTLPARFYRDEDAMVDAATRSTMANLLDLNSHLKIDLSVLAREPYYDSVLSRRRLVSYGLGGQQFWSVSPEDIVLMKLLWRKDSKSQKQWNNALSVVRVRGANLDWKYLNEWAPRLQLKQDLESLRIEAGV